MKKEVKVSFTELELDVLWSTLSGEIADVLGENKSWDEKKGIYDFYFQLREKIDLARK